MPATSKVLSIIDKGVRDRVTKNGETLRRHAESAQRWKNLRDRISRTEKEMENVRKILSGDTEYDSTTSGTASTQGGYLASPADQSRVSRVSSSGSATKSPISPLRRIAKKITGSRKNSPASVAASLSPLSVSQRALPSEDQSPNYNSISKTIRRQRTSIFGALHVGTPQTPERGHKHSQSYTPDSSPRGRKLDKLDLNATIRSNASKNRWNSSTKVETDAKGIPLRASSRPPSRPPSSQGYFAKDDKPIPSVGTPYRRSASRASMASSRPWSPISSSYSTTQSSVPFQHPPLSVPSHLSRAKTPSRPPPVTTAVTPRARPKTPSHIPAPKPALRSISGTVPFGGWDDDEPPPLPRPHSPSFSVSGQSASGHYPRPPSRSMIPLPSVQLSTPSRPGSAMSSFNRSESPTGSRTPFRSTALRAQTPDQALQGRAQQLPLFQGTIGRSGGRPSMPRLAPSSFRDGTSSGVSSRPSSRSGTQTPSHDGSPLHEYIPGNNHDPLDVEVAAIVNSIAHGLLVERVDPPLKKNQIPKEGEEIKAQYAFSNALARKVVTCRLTTLMRSGKSGDAITKKVMCRVGGGMSFRFLLLLF